MAYVGFGAGANPYIPTMSPNTGDVQIQLSRNPRSFAVTRYARHIDVDLDAGKYLKIDTQEQIRMVGGVNYNWVWALGNPAPQAQNIPFDLDNNFSCTRYAFPWQFPMERVGTAVWDVVAQHAQMRMVTAMTNRAIIASTRLAASGSWTESSSKFATIALLGTAAGISITGAFDASEGNIRKFFQAAGLLVKRNTAGAVNPQKDMLAVMNPITAAKMAESTEITNYVQNNPFAPQYLKGEENWAWLLPPSMFNVADIVIDDSVTVTSDVGAATTTYVYTIPTNAVVFVSKPAGLTENVGPSFATLTGFCCKPHNLSSWNWVDPKDNLLMGRVTDWIDYQVTCPLSGVYVTDITA